MNDSKNKVRVIRRKLDENDIYIGRTVRKIREHKNMSLGDLEQRADMAQGQLHLRESGQAYFTVSEIRDVAGALHVPVGTIFQLAEGYPVDLGMQLEFISLHDRLGGMLHSCSSIKEIHAIVQKILDDNPHLDGSRSD